VISGLDHIQDDRVPTRRIRSGYRIELIADGDGFSQRR